MAKRKFNKNYFQYGFTSIFDIRKEKGQYILCYKVLGHHSLRPSKLKLYLEKVHLNCKDKDVNFFKRKKDTVKRQRLDSTGEFQQHFTNIVKASYVVSFMIVKQCKLYTIGETLIKPCASKMAGIVLGEESKRKLQQSPLSNDIVQRRIVELADNIKEQVIAQIKNSQFVLFSIELDETTNVVSSSQLLVFC